MLATLLILSCGIVAVHPKRPNIIFFFIDDLGWDDLGFQSHQINTPTIDKFTAEGQFLEYHYGQQTCSPSRTSLLTGLFPLHSGINVAIDGDGVYGVPLKYRFLPEILLEGGYETHGLGLSGTLSSSLL